MWSGRLRCPQRPRRGVSCEFSVTSHKGEPCFDLNRYSRKIPADSCQGFWKDVRLEPGCGCFGVPLLVGRKLCDGEPFKALVALRYVLRRYFLSVTNVGHQ